MIRTAYALVVTLLLALGTILAQAPRSWTIDAKPILQLGDSEIDTASSFEAVVGATRLRDGRILVGDHGSYALRLFSRDGRHIRDFGRKGSGPDT